MKQYASFKGEFMKRMSLIATLSLFASIALAVENQQQPVATADPMNEMLSSDLRTIARVASVADDLDRSRQVLTAIVDSDIKTLRMPREDGSYKWASLQRVEGGRVKDEKSVEYVYTEKELRYVTVTGENGYRV